jgi:hypothetical protein
MTRHKTQMYHEQWFCHLTGALLNESVSLWNYPFVLWTSEYVR